MTARLALALLAGALLACGPPPLDPHPDQPGPPSRAECTGHDACPAPLRCRLGECICGCLFDDDCPPGTTCRACHCEPPPADPR